MRVLVTGGSGFLGRCIVDAAHQAGYEVLAPRSATFNLETGEHTDAWFADAIERGGPIDVIIHAAAHYGGIGINQAEPATIFHRNTLMAARVFDLAARHHVRKVLPVGSACAYPGHLSDDLCEDDFWAGPLHDSVEAYGFTKKIQLVAQRAYHKQFGLRSNHLILTNLYGPHDVFTEYRSHVVSALIKKFADAVQAGHDHITLWGDGSPIREFLYVNDAAEAIVRAVDLPHDLEPVNIGTGIGTRIRELAELIAEFTGFAGRIEWNTSKPNGVARKVLDVARMKHVLNWEPPTSLREGLESTIRWYLANKETADRRE